MIPFILAAVGGYLIGDSMKESKTFAEGGVMGSGNKNYQVSGRIIIDESVNGQDEMLRDSNTETFTTSVIASSEQEAEKIVEEQMMDKHLLDEYGTQLTGKKQYYSGSVEIDDVSVYAKGGMAGELSSNLIDFYNVAKKSDSVKNLQILDKDEFKFISESDDNCRVYIRYDKDSDTVVMLQHRKYSTDYSEDDDITLQQLKNYLKK